MPLVSDDCIPVDAKLNCIGDVLKQTVDVSTVIHAFKAAAIVVDNIPRSIQSNPIQSPT